MVISITTIYFKLKTPYNATMRYVEVLVGDAAYHGTKPLTYASEEPLKRGSVVEVPLKNKHVLGVVRDCTDKKPSFATKKATSLPIATLPTELITLATWLHTYYPAPLGAAFQHILPGKLPKKVSAEAFTLPPPIKAGLPALTPEQQEAVNNVTASGLHILRGITGSGKSRVYLELALKAVGQGSSVIVLSPEIGLTSQLAKNFTEVFGERVVVLHSQLTDATRRKAWLKILSATEPVIVIGARSALFSPLKNIGLIIVDEAHETAYKQDKSPYYHANVVAGMLGHLHNAPLVLGSATPLVTDYFFAEQKKRPIILMQHAAKGDHAQRSIEVIDLRDRSNFSKSPIISDKILEATKQALANKEQILLFLNRRGTARVILCTECGWQSACPHCDLPLVYHNDSHIVRCHSCTYYAHPPTACNECHNTSVVFKSLGTKAIYEEIQRLFPEARAMRFDNDNAKHERIEHHFDAIAAGDIDILVGTQTLAKGLDLPRLSVVGVVIADTSLYVPDFSSQERTFQLINQVIGRVGRGHIPGKVCIQTYNPSNPTLAAALTYDWEKFYNHELDERQRFGFPPFYFMAKLWCRRASSTSAQRAATSLAQAFTKSGLRIVVEGPTPSFHEKVQGKFEWQIIIKSKQRNELIRAINTLPPNWSHDIDPMNLL